MEQQFDIVEPGMQSVVKPHGPRPDQVTLIRKAIDLSNRIALSSFGERAQRAATTFSERVLAAVGGDGAGDPGTVIQVMLDKTKALDPNALRQRPGLIGRMFNKPEDRLAAFRTSYDGVASTIDELAVDVERHREALRTDILVLEGLYGDTMVSLRDLDEHVAAGRLAIDEERSRPSPVMDGDGDALMAAQDAMDRSQAVDRLEKRVLTLAQARQIAFQQLPHIRLVQSGNETLMQNLGAALDLTIPAWKQRMMILMGLARQGNALRMDEDISNATGRMITETASLLKTQALAIEKRSQKGIVDIEALEEANDILVSTLRELAEQQGKGRAERNETFGRIDALRTQLSTAMQASGR